MLLPADPARLKTRSTATAHGSRRRFRTDFETLYAIRLIERQARWYGRLDTALSSAAAVAGAATLGAFAGGWPSLGAAAALVLIASIWTTSHYAPRARWAACNALHAALTRLRAHALELDDTQYEDALIALRDRAGTPVWAALHLPTYHQVCEELGCTSDMRRRRPWTEMLIEKLP